jgi:hypothetical protein
MSSVAVDAVKLLDVDADEMVAPPEVVPVRFELKVTVDMVT